MYAMPALLTSVCHRIALEIASVSASVARSAAALSEHVLANDSIAAALKVASNFEYQHLHAVSTRGNSTGRIVAP